MAWPDIRRYRFAGTRKTRSMPVRGLSASVARGQPPDPQNTLQKSVSPGLSPRGKPADLPKSSFLVSDPDVHLVDGLRLLLPVAKRQEQDGLPIVWAFGPLPAFSAVNFQVITR
jgi:hypothetical protein